MKPFLLMIVTILIVLSSAVYGLEENIEFSLNEIWTFSGNKTFNITIPKNTTVINSNLIFTTPDNPIEDDSEDSYACTSNPLYYPCKNAVDESWGSFLRPWPTSIVYENYTIPSNVESANWTYKTAIWGASVFNVSYWNYTSNNWEFLDTHVPSGTHTKIIPKDGLNSVLQIKTYLKRAIPQNMHYYEGKVTWHYYSQLVSVEIEDSLVFNHTETHEIDRPIELSSALNKALMKCVPDSHGNCNIPVTVHSNTLGEVGLLLNMELFSFPFNPTQLTDHVDIDLDGSTNIVSYSYDKFSDDSLEKNVSFVDYLDKRVYLKLPKDVNVTNAVLNLTGYIENDLTYQENATGISCSGTWYSGWLGICSSVYDGNWDTFAIADATVYFNYTKPVDPTLADGKWLS